VPKRIVLLAVISFPSYPLYQLSVTINLSIQNCLNQVITSVFSAFLDRKPETPAAKKV